MPVPFHNYSIRQNRTSQQTPLTSSPNFKQSQILLTCEHASNQIPAPCKQLFAGHESELNSHRGWDPGTLKLGEALECKLKVPLFKTTVSRLLVEVNRSKHHPRLFSEFTRSLPEADKEKLIAQYYAPHRDAVENWIRAEIENGKNVVHLSLHSFTPELNGEIRNAEIGLLYDPSRVNEKAFCKEWKDAFRTVAPDWRVRMNYPYAGKADGFTTYLRKQFTAPKYAGIELEVNQALMEPGKIKSTIKTIVNSLTQLHPA
ncbi:MAG: N-formylglutamate amidohydrolase [Pirellulaceae bacterium]